MKRKLITKSSSPANDSNANSLKQMYAREAIEGSVYEYLCLLDYKLKVLKQNHTIHTLFNTSSPTLAS